jgi:hypothetical protein
MYAHDTDSKQKERAVPLQSPVDASATSVKALPVVQPLPLASVSVVHSQSQQQENTANEHKDSVAQADVADDVTSMKLEVDAAEPLSQRGANSGATAAMAALVPDSVHAHSLQVCRK